MNGVWGRSSLRFALLSQCGWGDWEKRKENSVYLKLAAFCLGLIIQFVQCGCTQYRLWNNNNIWQHFYSMDVTWQSQRAEALALQFNFPCMLSPHSWGFSLQTAQTAALDVEADEICNHFLVSQHRRRGWGGCYLIKTANWVRDLCGLLPTCETRFPDRRQRGWREQRDGVIGLKHTGLSLCQQGLESVVMIAGSNENEERAIEVHEPLPSQLEGSSCPLVVRYMNRKHVSYLFVLFNMAVLDSVVTGKK